MCVQTQFERYKCHKSFTLKNSKLEQVVLHLSIQKAKIFTPSDGIHCKELERIEPGDIVMT